MQFETLDEMDNFLGNSDYKFDAIRVKKFKQTNFYRRNINRKLTHTKNVISWIHKWFLQNLQRPDCPNIL